MLKPKLVLSFPFDMARYCWIYFKMTVHNGVIWGRLESVEDNDAMLSKRYPNTGGSLGWITSIMF